MISIFRYLGSLGRVCTLRFEGSFPLPITFYLNPFGHPVIDQLVEHLTSNPKFPCSIPARDNQNLLKKISGVGDFHLWLFGTLESYILRI